MKYLILVFVFFSSNLYAKEIVCLPVKLDAPFEKVVLSKEGRGNIYTMQVLKDDQAIVSSDLSFRFLRRGQISVFQNKDKSVEIKTLRLVRNRVLRSSIKISSLFGGTMSGVCKLY